MEIDSHPRVFWLPIYILTSVFPILYYLIMVRYHVEKPVNNCKYYMNM